MLGTIRRNWVTRKKIKEEDVVVVRRSSRNMKGIRYSKWVDPVLMLGLVPVEEEQEDHQDFNMIKIIQYRRKQ